MNIVTLVGNVGKDPESRTSQSGAVIARFSLATQRPTKERTTDWHRCTAFGKTAEVVLQYVRKGGQVGIVGSIQYSESEGRHFSEIIVDRLELMARPKTEGQAAHPMPNGDELPPF